MIRLLNNEAIGLITIQSFLKQKGTLNILNCYLILPMLFDKKIRSYLKNRSVNVVSFQQLFVDKTELFIGFSDKYKDALSVSTNSILMGLEIGLFRLDGNDLSLVNEDVSFDDLVTIKKMKEIFSATENLSIALSDDPELIYALARIEI